jgi:hypothetical protein
MIDEAINSPAFINRLTEIVYEKLPSRQVEASLHICDTFAVDPNKKYIINIPGSDQDNQIYIAKIHQALKEFGLNDCLIVTGGIEILEAYEPPAPISDSEISKVDT